MVRDVFELLGKCLVLVVDVADGEFFFLVWVDADAVDEITGEHEVFQFACNISLPGVSQVSVDPAEERVPFSVHEHLASDVDVGEERDAEGGFYSFSVLMHFYVRVDDVLDDDEVFVFTDFSDHPDDLIKHHFVCQLHYLCITFQRHERRRTGVVFDFDEPVSVMCGFHVFYDTDELHIDHGFFYTVDGDELGDFSSLGGEDLSYRLVAFSEEADEILRGAFTGSFSCDIIDDAYFGVVVPREWFPAFDCFYIEGLEWFFLLWLWLFFFSVFFVFFFVDFFWEAWFVVYF